MIEAEYMTVVYNLYIYGTEVNHDLPNISFFSAIGYIGNAKKCGIGHYMKVCFIIRVKFGFKLCCSQ